MKSIREKVIVESNPLGKISLGGDVLRKNTRKLKGEGGSGGRRRPEKEVVKNTALEPSTRSQKTLGSGTNKKKRLRQLHLKETC